MLVAPSKLEVVRDEHVTWGEVVHKVQPDEFFVHVDSHFLQCSKQFHDLADDDGRIFTWLKPSAEYLSAKQ